MKLPRLAWPRLPLLPRWVAALPATGELRTFRLRVRWDGRQELLPAEPPRGAACVAVVARPALFRRRLQRLPEGAKARSALLRAAADEFPLGEALYGLGVHGGDGYLYALPLAALAPLAERGWRAAAVLPGEPPLDAAACLAALADYRRLGASFDLLRAGWRLSRLGWLHLRLGAALATALLATAWLLAAPQTLERLLDWRLNALRAQAGGLPAMYRSSEKMAYAQAEAAKLYASPEARLPAELSQLLTAAPRGRPLTRIEYANGRLTMSGPDLPPMPWPPDAATPGVAPGR